MRHPHPRRLCPHWLPARYSVDGVGGVVVVVVAVVMVKSNARSRHMEHMMDITFSTIDHTD